MRVADYARLPVEERRLELEDAVRGSLLPDEQILWVGRPLAWRLFTAADIFLVPFSLVWTGFILSALIAPSGKPASGPGLLFSIPFLAIGLYVIFGRFVYKAWMNLHTVYAVTDRRVMVVTRGIGRRVRSAFLEALPTIETSIGRGGVGSITFGTGGGSTFAWADWTSGGRNARPLGFYDIRDANQVAEMISDRHRRVLEAR